METVTIPTVGRAVHYFPKFADTHCSANSAVVLPATVVQVFGERLNLVVMCMNADAPVVQRFSVPHKSQIAKKENTEELGEFSYWDWPAKV